MCGRECEALWGYECGSHHCSSIRDREEQSHSQDLVGPLAGRDSWLPQMSTAVVEAWLRGGAGEETLCHLALHVPGLVRHWPSTTSQRARETAEAAYVSASRITEHGFKGGRWIRRVPKRPLSTCLIPLPSSPSSWTTGPDGSSIWSLLLLLERSTHPYCCGTKVATGSMYISKQI